MTFLAKAALDAKETLIGSPSFDGWWRSDDPSTATAAFVSYPPLNLPLDSSYTCRQNTSAGRAMRNPWSSVPSVSNGGRNPAYRNRTKYRYLTPEYSSAERICHDISRPVENSIEIPKSRSSVTDYSTTCMVEGSNKKDWPCSDALRIPTSHSSAWSWHVFSRSPAFASSIKWYPKDIKPSYFLPANEQLLHAMQLNEVVASRQFAVDAAEAAIHWAFSHFVWQCSRCFCLIIGLGKHQKMLADDLVGNGC